MTWEPVRVLLRRGVAASSATALVAGALLVLIRSPVQGGDAPRILFTSDRNFHGLPFQNHDTDVYSMQVDGSDQTDLTPDIYWERDPVASPDGSRIALSSTQPCSFFFPDGAYGVVLMNGDGSNPVRVTPGVYILPNGSLTCAPVFHRYPSFSPDGSALIFTDSIAPGGPPTQEDLLQLDIATGTIQNLTSNPANDRHGVYTPDGRRIVFESDRDGKPQLYVMNANGSNVARIIADSPGDDHLPVVSPDGSKVAFASDRSGNLEIYIVNVDGSDFTQLTTNAATDTEPAFSPDGQSIVFASDRDGNFEIYLMKVDGGAQQRLTDNPASERQPVFLITHAGPLDTPAASPTPTPVLSPAIPTRTRTSTATPTAASMGSPTSTRTASPTPPDKCPYPTSISVRLASQGGGLVGQELTLTATVLCATDSAVGVPNVSVTFTVISGPNAGITGTSPTDAQGHAVFKYRGVSVGGIDGIAFDHIQASVTDPLTGEVKSSSEVAVYWARRTLLYYALGDSVAAGHGLPSGDGQKYGTCRLSPDAYPAKVAQQLDQFPNLYWAAGKNFSNFACTGATTNESDGDSGNWCNWHTPFDAVDLPRQVDQLLRNRNFHSGFVVLVSITVGVDNFDFTDESLAGTHLCKSEDEFHEWVASTTSQIEKDLAKQAIRILGSVPNSRIVLTDYFNAFNAESNWLKLLTVPWPLTTSAGLVQANVGWNRDCGDLSVKELYKRSQYAVDALNDALRTTTRTLARTYSGRVTMVGLDPTAGMEQAFRGHESPRTTCGSAGPGIADTFIQYPLWDVRWVFEQPVIVAPITCAYVNDFFAGEDCFHPNKKGAQEYADGVVQAAQTFFAMGSSGSVHGAAGVVRFEPVATRAQLGADTCCVAGGGVACADAACRLCVCDRDSLCCDTLWDDFCVATAGIECRETCACVAATPSDTVPPSGSPTPTAPGTPPPVTTPTPGGACCGAHDGSQCDAPACNSCVCGADAYCCGSLWDHFCTDMASTQCANACGCDTPVPTTTSIPSATPTVTVTGSPPTATPTPTPGGPCCNAHGGARCDIAACASCVCTVDSFCCTLLWDEFCVRVAAEECTVGCGCEIPPTKTATILRTPTAPPPTTPMAVTIIVPDAFSTIQAAIDAAPDGGIIRVRPGTYQETLTLSGRTLTLQSTDGPETTIIDARGFGSVVSVINGGVVAIQGLSITNGQSENGGGVNIESSHVSMPTEVSLCNNKIFNNVATGYGGGVSVVTDGGRISLAVDGNLIAANKGGGIATNADGTSTVEIESSGNTLDGNGGTGFYINPVAEGALGVHSTADKISNNSGGGIIISAVGQGRSEVRFDRVSVKDNNAKAGSHLGGGVSMLVGDSASGTLSIAGSSVQGNVGENGGGLLVASSQLAVFDLHLTGSTVSGNSAYFGGGGVMVLGAGSAAIEGNDISGNRNYNAGSGSLLPGGGGIRIVSSLLDLSLARNTISRNSAGNGVNSASGAGISITNTGSLSLRAANNLLVENCGYCARGCAIDVDDQGTSDVAAINNTMVSHECSGYPFYVTSTGNTNLSVVNSIVVGGAQTDLYNVLNRADITIAHSNLGGTFGRYTDAGGNISADPRFADPANGDYSLSSGSPCIDSGTANGAPADDLFGNPRPLGPGVDMGALEFGYATPTPTGTVTPTITPT